MKTSARLLLGFGLLVLTAVPAHAQIDMSTDHGQIQAALRDVRVAMAAGDVDGVMSHYWNDPRMTVIDPDEGIRLDGWTYYKTWLTDRLPVQKNLLWRAHERVFHLHGDNAYVTFLVTRQVEMGHSVRQKNERGTYVLKKIDGKWLVVAQHISDWPKTLLFQQTR
jgi:ketosteroid isomerase-like protein